MSNALTAKMDKIEGALGSMTELLSALQSRVAEVDAKAGGDGGGGGGDRPPGSCFMCGKQGHQMQQCSKLPKDMKEAMKLLKDKGDK